MSGTTQNMIVEVSEMEDMVLIATEKLMEEATSGGAEELKRMIIDALDGQDLQLAEHIMEKNKTMATCWKHITEWARKKAVNNCAVIAKEEVLSEAIHYFLDVEEKGATEIKPIVSNAKKPSFIPENRHVLNTKVEKVSSDEVMSLF